MTDPVDALEAGLSIAAALEQYGISYALGGALAYGQYGIPRATNDVDANVFVGPDALGPVFEAIRSLGIEIDEASARAAAIDAGLIVLRYGMYRPDVYTPSVPFSSQGERTRVRHTIDGRDVWFLSAEALCVFKLLFFRCKDVVDLERLVAVHGTALDGAYVRAQIVAMLGADDPRVATWDRLLAEHGPG